MTCAARIRIRAWETFILTSKMRVLAHFMRAADEHMPFLLRKAQRLEEYLQQR